MHEILIAVAIFAALIVAYVLSQRLYGWLPESQREEDTHQVVRSLAGLFVVMASLVLGLMLNSAKTTFEGVDHNVHAFATDLILFDRTLQLYGPEASDTRQNLLAYVKRAANDGHVTNPDQGDRIAEENLNAIGRSLRAIHPLDPEHLARWQDSLNQYHKIVERRWTLVEQSEGTIPAPMIVMLVLWLMLIFASFGYRAPRNMVTITSFVGSAALIAGAIYLIIDMDVPFSGPIHVSAKPLERVVVEIQRQ
ncbi:MAG: DUF4239 domain-containing protein [Afipia sp.]|nr:DUF4239 domain-containing protein [Afipia sp.]